MLSNFNRDFELMDRFESDMIRILCYDLKADYSGNYKSYEYSRLCTILTGEKKITVNDNESFCYDHNGILLLPPNSKIHMTISRPTKAVVFELNNSMLNEINHMVSEDYAVNHEILSKSNYYVTTKTLEIDDVTNRIMEKITQGEKNCEYLIDLYARELMFYLVQNSGIHHILNHEINNPINKAIRFMNENYAVSFTVKQLAYDLGMSEAAFCQYFKKITKTTPNIFMTKIKLSKAKEMLLHNSVTETAFNLGYGNISYFIALFKKEFGITPKQYQKVLF